ncbi:CAP domain-containing protein [Lentilactobacillus sp. Marseille-Q4993]|uniref:CAP domain-containing protein n=1 Tax=Lentilactobacillus sp. Marseille-Q4993 TaxID=3039492 RepID=UPI0024BC29B3|nr:CAP domain-containing protein [Lentilactobacillus sp. Marseille-Q4993]
MKQNWVIKSVMIAGLSLGLTATVDATYSLTSNGTTAFAKAKKNKVVKYHYFKTTKYSLKKGTLYKTATLKKIAHYAKNYKHTTFKSGLYAQVKLANGKKINYNYVKSTNGKTKGWIKHSYLKKVATKKAATSSNSNTSSSNSDNSTNTPTVDTSSDSSTTSTSSKHQFNFSQDEYRSAFLSALNSERTKRGLQPLKEDAKLDEVAAARGPQLVTNFDHYDSNGKAYADELAEKLGIAYPAENIAMVSAGYGSYGKGDLKVSSISTATDVAKQNVYEYIYDDADSNWGHRDNMLNKSYTAVGMGITYDSKSGAVYTAADFGGDTSANSYTNYVDESTGSTSSKGGTHIFANGTEVPVDVPFTVTSDGQVIIHNK